MSVKRYSPVLRTDTARGKGYQFAEMEQDEVGQWVSIADYGVVKAENEEIHADYEALANEHTKLTERHRSLRAEVKRLEKELKDEKSANTNVEGRMQSANLSLSMANHNLKAEVERLTALIESNLNSSKVAMGKADAVLRERDTLIGEVERLRKAGDAVALCLCGGTTDDHNKRCALEWLAAKEGKPSA